MDIHQTIDILLVEDNLHEAQLAIRSFNKSNLQAKLLHIDDGEEALDLIFSCNKYAQRALQNLPGIILLDLKLPKISGLEILKKIKTDPRTRVVPVIMLTSSREAPDIASCYLAGANSYIVKPVDFDAFSKAVKELGIYWMLLNQSPIP